jgi:stage II sporulation protein P
MRKYRIRIRLKIYPVLWCAIILASIYLLVRFAALSFSEDIGQAGLMNAVIAKLCSKVIEEGPSLVSYTAKEDGNASFLGNVVEERFALQNFITDSSAATVKAEGYSSIFNNLSAGTDIAAAADQAGAAKEVMNTTASIGLYEIASDFLSREYIMTNGAIVRSGTTGGLIWDEAMADQLQIGYLKGNITPGAVNEDIAGRHHETAVAAVSTGTIDFTMEQLKDVSFLVRNFYFVDASTVVTDSLFDAEKLLGKDMTMKQGNDKPQILILHTHSQEAFADSRPGVEADTVVGVGSYLTKILTEDYGYNVIHDTTYYDVIGGKDGKNGYNVSYSEAEAGIKKVLEENPTIEVVIDLHRNSGDKKVVTIDGEETAQIMLFNGLCRDQNGLITYLDNPYLQDNLAFSLQLQLKSLELYPGLFNRNYLKSYRYNMHFRPKYILMELGTWKNTVGQAKNAMGPFARILDSVLRGQGSAIN